MTLTSAVERDSAIVPWVVVGIVKANDDPLELGRVRVAFPTLHPGALSFWIRMAVPMAGPQSGFMAIPHVGDEVLVAFLHGRHDVGVVLGQLWNGVDRPPSEAYGEDPSVAPEPSSDEPPSGVEKVVLWRSRRGHLLLLDDTPGAEAIQIRDHTRKLSLVFDCASSTLHLGNEAGDVSVWAQGNLRLAAAGDVSLEAGQDLRTVSGATTAHEVGSDFTLTAQQAVTLSSGGAFVATSTSATLTCKSATRTRIEGTSVELSARSDALVHGATSTRIQGGTVKIN